MHAMIARETLKEILNFHGTEKEWVDVSVLGHFERLDPKSDQSDAGDKFLQSIGANCSFEDEGRV